MNYVRLYEVTDISELALIKTQLRQGAIDFRVQFERTLQIGGPYEMGRQGAQVEVAQPDLERAKWLLAELGIIVDYPAGMDRFHFLARFDEATLTWPLVGNWEVGLRFLAVAGLILIALFLGMLAYL